MLTVTAALRRFVGDFGRLHSPTHRQHRVLDWLCACQTSALGGRMVKCACGWSSPMYNSCTDRHCPQCRGGVRAEWLATRCDQLLPVPHFQVVFTLPGALRTLACDNPRVVYDLQFRAAAETLQQLAAQRLDAQFGVLAMLHTWASDMSFHPHVHCLVTAGGLRTDQEAWVETGPGYLFPTRVMAAMVRGKVIKGLRAAFDAGELFVRGDPAHAEVAFDAAVRKAFRHRWVVHVEAPDGRPAETAAKYLARYVGGIAISDARMVAVTDTHVSYKTRKGVRTVEGHEFVR
ncbi:MAG: transposase, partial [Deltaproteobacteria bacterium]|nr:transposase [Deltaproteobacteria bacterium]